VELKIEQGKISVLTDVHNRKQQALWGLTRSLVRNMVIGVSNGFERVLEINGVGFKAESKDKTITLSLGFSHPISFNLPEGITASIDRNTVKLTGIDKEALGHTAAAIRRLKPPEPYKGKGIKYAEERIQKKAGKTGTK
jgi:large subunit ribosomal protein L6